MFTTPTGLTRSLAFAGGCGLLVGGLVFGSLATRLVGPELLLVAFTCAAGTALVAWSLSVLRFLDGEGPLPPRRRGFDVIPNRADRDRVENTAWPSEAGDDR